MMDNDSDENGHEKTHWLEIKRYRNRVNSQKTRNRERDQLGHLTHKKSCLYLSNTALMYQNQHMREAIQRIREQLLLGSIPAPDPPPSIGNSSAFFQPVHSNPSMMAPQPQHPSLQQLSSAISAGILQQLMAPNSLAQAMGSQQFPPSAIPLHNTAAMTSLQQGLNLRNPAANMSIPYQPMYPAPRQDFSIGNQGDGSLTSTARESKEDDDEQITWGNP